MRDFQRSGVESARTDAEKLVGLKEPDLNKRESYTADSSVFIGKNPAALKVTGVNQEGGMI